MLYGIDAGEDAKCTRNVTATAVMTALIAVAISGVFAVSLAVRGLHGVAVYVG